MKHTWDPALWRQVQEFEVNECRLYSDTWSQSHELGMQLSDNQSGQDLGFSLISIIVNKIEKKGRKKDGEYVGT